MSVDADISLFCFDSILVRLKGKSTRKRMKPLREFRFHTGSIKSGINDEGEYTVFCFDSILVRLKVEPFYLIGPDRARFDSILVRLKEL